MPRKLLFNFSNTGASVTQHYSFKNSLDAKCKLTLWNALGWYAITARTYEILAYIFRPYHDRHLTSYHGGDNWLLFAVPIRPVKRFYNVVWQFSCKDFVLINLIHA